MKAVSAGGVVAIASALAVAFLAWFAYTLGFSPELWVALSGALVGGVLAMLGNYLGSRALIDWEWRREERDLVGAIQVARSEINKRLVDHLRTEMKVHMPPPSSPNPFKGQGA